MQHALAQLSVRGRENVDVGRSVRPEGVLQEPDQACWGVRVERSGVRMRQTHDQTSHQNRTQQSWAVTASGASMNRRDRDQLFLRDGEVSENGADSCDHEVASTRDEEG